MNNAISTVPALAPQAAMPSAGAIPNAAPAKTSRDISPAPVDIQLPDRPHIQYDAEQMRRNLQDAIKRLNERVQSQQQNLNFRLDETANRFVITVKNTGTGEVIRQIPDDVVLKLAHNIEDLKGLLHNKVT
jgi:flagellar protein FlaG